MEQAQRLGRPDERRGRGLRFSRRVGGSGEGGRACALARPYANLPLGSRLVAERERERESPLVPCVSPAVALADGNEIKLKLKLGIIIRRRSEISSLKWPARLAVAPSTQT